MKSPWLLMLGLIITLGGVGGVEQSLDDVALIQSTAVAILGLIITWMGALVINATDDDPDGYYQDNTYGDTSQYRNN